jgi:hypothetical protein
MGARRASASALVAVVGGVLLITLLVAWASAIGPSEVLRGEGPTVERSDPTEDPYESETTSQDVLDALEEGLDRERGHSTVLNGVAVVIMVLLLAVLLFWAYKVARWGVAEWRSRERREAPPPDVDFDVLGESAALVREIADGAAAQRDLLQAGTPRNAIVEMWNRFETLAGNAGATRRPSETSSEFTLRVLGAVDADSSAVARLAALYREARFSDHELSEEHRAAAVAALEAIHAGLTAGHRAGLT